jgi:hypothetical protein
MSQWLPGHLNCHAFDRHLVQISHTLCVGLSYWPLLYSFGKDSLEMHFPRIHLLLLVGSSGLNSTAEEPNCRQAPKGKKAKKKKKKKLMVCKVKEKLSMCLTKH